jgi:SAM-dependent methyltransferase
MSASLPSLGIQSVLPAGAAARRVLRKQSKEDQKQGDGELSVCVVLENDSGTEDKDAGRGRFSQRKGQCDLWEYVWGSTFVAAECVAAFAEEVKGLHERDGDEGKEGGGAAVPESGRTQESDPLWCLELGCGSGVASCVGAMSGLDFTATDAVCDALRVSCRTALLNGFRAGFEGQSGGTPCVVLGSPSVPFGADGVGPDPSVSAESSEAEVDGDGAVSPSDSASESGTREGPSGSVRYRVLDWHRDPAELALPVSRTLENEPDVAGAALQSGFDLIVGADVLFFGRAARPVATCCARLLRQDGLVVVVDPARGHAETFADCLRDEGIVEVEQVRRENIDPVLGGKLPMRACELVVGHRGGERPRRIAKAVLAAFAALPLVGEREGNKDGNGEFRYVLG